MTKKRNTKTKKTRSKSKRKREVIPQPDRNMSLTQIGYSLSNSAEKRQKTLKHAVRKYGYTAVLRRIKLIYNLTPESSDKHNAKKDMKYVTLLNRNMVMRGSE